MDNNNLQAWREKRQKGEAAELPSGLMIMVRRVSMMDLAASGKVPVDLQPRIDELIRLGNAGKQPEFSLEWFNEFAEVVKLVAESCLTGPEGLSVDELDYNDQLAIYTWANEEGGKLKPFRRQQDGAVDGGRAGQALRAKTE